MRLQIAELRELAEVTLGGSWSEAEVRDNEYDRHQSHVNEIVSSYLYVVF